MRERAFGHLSESHIPFTSIWTTVYSFRWSESLDSAAQLVQLACHDRKWLHVRSDACGRVLVKSHGASLESYANGSGGNVLVFAYSNFRSN